ncbi:oligosaccharide flippase family protein [Neobacillus mesonae]|uniref:oligosaccharide flippase family protein n=1 Tax=Neobacillus mesonae TaxID=1193713 RepID=UPI000834F3C1|nr:oligosaccharide flippase family protein [Neobacillus mesonae]
MKKTNLVKTGSIYLICSICVNIVNLFLIPLYTGNLSIDEFGQYNIITSIQGLLSIFINLSIFAGMSRFLYEYEDKNRVKNITLTFSFIWGILILIIGKCVSPFFANSLFENDVNGVFYIQYILLNSFMLSLITIFETYYSMIYKALKSSLILVSKIILVLVFSIYFLVIKDYKIDGILYAQFYSYLLLLTVIILIDLKHIMFTFGKKELKEQLLYGIGLIPGQISAWILTLIDRYFIKELINLSAVGIYSLAYNIGMLIQPVFLIPFNKIFTPYKFQVYSQHDGKYKIQKMFKYYNLIGWFCVFGLSIFAKLGVNILGTSEYEGAYYLVSLIAISYFLWGLGSFYGLGLHISNKMWTNSGIAFLGAVVNVLLNIVLIPVFKIFGAALSTVLAYILMNIIYYLAGKKHYDIGISILLPYKYGLVFIVIFPIYYVIGNMIDIVWFEIPLNLFLILVYILLNILMGFISKEDVTLIVSKLKGRLRGK